jgi:uncharacterized protein YecE (DUF72 family)
VAERRSVAADVVGSNPTSRPNPSSASSSQNAQTLSPRAHERPALPRSSKSTSEAATTLPAGHLPATPNLFIGTSGWAYPTWKPGFYPAKTPARAFLNYYASQLTAVEVNYTFRTLPTATQLETWLSATPAAFRFSFKAPQRITHFQRLKPSPELDTALFAFLASIEPAHTAAKLGPILFQLPPNFAIDLTRLATFLASPIFVSHPHIRLAFEFRHPTWFADDTYDLLRRHNAALCIAEGDDLVTPDISTASFHCYRLRRSGGYNAAELSAFAQRFTNLAHTSELYAFLRHEDEPTGALNAQALLQKAAAIGGAR